MLVVLNMVISLIHRMVRLEHWFVLKGITSLDCQTGCFGKLNLSTLWGFVSGISVMSVIWVIASHAELTCPQKSFIIFIMILVSVSLAISFTLLKEIKVSR